MLDEVIPQINFTENVTRAGKNVLRFLKFPTRNCESTKQVL